VASIDNFLRRAILSGRAQMNGLLMFISLLGAQVEAPHEAPGLLALIASGSEGRKP
jgi:hypothetical protein